MQYDVARAQLRQHLAWTKFIDDEFISWTSSLLWALQFAVRKTKKSTEHELRVCVLDTSRFHTSTFFSAPHLIQYFRLSEYSDIIDKYHTTEYLAHGSLNVRNCSSTVSLACLRENGLFDLMPELDEEHWKQRLFLRVRNLRWTMVSAVNPLSAVTCQGALQTASTFGEKWTMVMMIAFLALRGSPQDSGELLRFIRELAGKISSNAPLCAHWLIASQEPERDFLEPLPPYEGHYVDAPELANFAEMMRLGFAEMQKIRLQESDGLDQLNAGTNRLTLESDEVADTANDTSETTPADDPSPSAPQPAAFRASRKITTTVVIPTLNRASIATVKVVGKNVRHPDLPTAIKVGEEDEIKPAVDPISSTAIALGSGRVAGHITVSVEFSEDGYDGDDETEGSSHEEGLQVIV